MLYSDQLELYSDRLADEVMNDIEVVRKYFSLDEIRILKLDDLRVAVPVTLKVSLPTQGAVNGIDIRKEEPILICFSNRYHPHSSPVVMSDRKDFPKKFLSHLYASGSENQPGKLCLVRNSLNEWFANKRMEDLLAVTEEWFFKAGSGRLVEDGNEFDTTRLESFSGFHIYDYEMVYQTVNENIRFDNENPFAVLLGGFDEEKRGLSVKSVASIPLIQLENVYNGILKLVNEKKAKLFPSFTLLVWDEELRIDNTYITCLPENYGQLKLYFNAKGINIQALLTKYRGYIPEFFQWIPIIHAIKRPKKIVGQPGDIEFINFLLQIENSESKAIPDNTIVKVNSHIEPFSKRLAKVVSDEDRTAKSLFIGAGSLGSKIIIHDIRTGKLVVGVSDSKNLLEHNLTRHSLFADKIGWNKANAIVDLMDKINNASKGKDYTAFPYDCYLMDDNQFEKYNWLVDTSASQGVQNWLVEKSFSSTKSIARCELVNRGKLGLLYMEGKGRNPRIDDLVNLTYYRAIENQYIKEWRKYDSETDAMQLDIGQGCSSTTTIMGDDTISFHASLFSKMLYRDENGFTRGDKGMLFRTIYEFENIIDVKTELEIIEPFEIYKCQNKSGWEIRFINGMSAEFIRLCKSKGKIETGGALIGVANYKTKTIHVFDKIAEPKGSIGTCSGFTRAVGEMPEIINKVKLDTGQIIGYIGEWHTHPMSLEGLSGTDIGTIEKLIPINRKEPIPTLALIVTNDKMLPFVFE